MLVGGYFRHFLYLPYECVSFYHSSWLSASLCEHLLRLTSILSLGFKAKGFEFQNHASHPLSGGSLTPVLWALDTFDQNKSYLLWVLIGLHCGCGYSQKQAAFLWFSREPLGCTSHKKRQHIKRRLCSSSGAPRASYEECWQHGHLYSATV